MTYDSEAGGSDKSSDNSDTITREGPMSIPKKVEAIQAVAIPKNSQTIGSVYRHD